jgi:hypothetical protein
MHGGGGQGAEPPRGAFVVRNWVRKRALATATGMTRYDAAFLHVCDGHRELDP